MQAERQGRPQPLARQSVDLLRQADGADGNPALPDAEPPSGVEPPDRLDGDLVVRQRLPHPHEDDVAEPLAALVQELGGPHRLLEHFADAQVAQRAADAAGAEPTADVTPDLARETDSAARALARRRDHHTLGGAAVGPLHEQFGGATRRLRAGDLATGSHPEALGESPTELGRQVGHHVERACPALERPRQDLPRPVGRLTALGEPLLELLRRGAE